MAQPTIRSRPSWYLPLLPAIIRSLTSVLRIHNPTLYTLRSFVATSTDLDSDGVHFSALSGQDYVVHLLDQSRFVYTYKDYGNLLFLVGSSFVSKKFLV